MAVARFLCWERSFWHCTTMPVVGDAHRAVGPVDVLAAGTGRPVGIDPQVLVQDLDLDRIVDHRIDPDAGETGVTPGLGIEGRDPHQTMHAGLCLQPAVGVVARNLDRGRLDAGLLAAAFLQPLDLVAVRIGPAGVHAQQHLGPVLGLGAAGPGIDLQEGVVGVGLARQQALELQLLGALLQRRQRGELLVGLGQAVLVAFGFAQFDQGQGVLKAAFKFAEILQALVQRRALAHQRLGGVRVFPEARALGQLVQFVEPTLRCLDVKDASE